MSSNARRLRLLLLTVTVMSLAACIEVGPDYKRPSINTPAYYKEGRPQDRQPVAQLPATGKWWTIYHDPVLDGLLTQVNVSNNQSLVASAARVSEAQQMVKAARSAWFPAVSAGSFKTGRSNQTDFGIAASWELDLWGQVRRDVEAHRADAEARADDLAAASLSMQAQLAQSYFALRENDALIGVLQHVVDVDRQWVRMLRAQYAQGVAGSAEMAEALTRFIAVETQLADINTSRAQLEHAIAVMLGKPPAEFSIAPAPFNVEVPQIPTGLPASLLQRRPDIAASERRMAAASARIGVSKANAFPAVTLSAGVGVRKGLRALPGIEAPLFTGGQLQAQTANARAVYTEVVADYRQTVLNAFREVEDNLIAEEQLANVASLQNEAASAAQDSMRVVHNQYLQGVADYRSWIDASTTALNAGQADMQLRLRRLDTSVNLIKALGGGWQTGLGQPVNSGAALHQARATTPAERSSQR